MRLIIGITALSLAAFSINSETSAATVLFNFTGPHTISFKIGQSPTPDFYTSNFFRLNNIAYTEDGNKLFSFADFGLSDIFLGAHDFIIPDQYFSGGTKTPTFILGSYDVRDRSSGPSGYSMSISNVSGAVPEPAIWATMLLGFGAVGALMRKRQGEETRATA